MDLSVYQQRARDFKTYSDEHQIAYPVLGLGEKTLKLAGKIKESVWDGTVDRDLFLASVSKEIGDALWHLANLASDVGLDLADIAHDNLERLADRAKRGRLQGSGDYR